MKKISKWVYIMIGLLLIIFVVWSLTRTGQTEDKKGPGNRKPPKVEAFVVKPSVLIKEISISGSLLAFEEVELKNEIAGRVVSINLPEGQFVKEGTLLVKLFDDDLKANLKKLESQLAIQQQTYDRQSELLKVNGLSQNEFDQTSLLVNSLKAEIEVQQVQIRKTEVRAPFDGVLGLRNISIGAVVTPSTLLTTIRSENKLKLDFSVPEKYSSEIQPGMKVVFSLDNTEVQYNATVMATEMGINQSTRNLKVRAVVDNQSKHLLPGAFANVFLQFGENNNALMVPTQAVIPQERDKSVIVARNGLAHFTPVKTGIRKASTIEVTEGLQIGDTIITSGILFLKEGSKLSYSSVKSDPE